jgi:hypothetical protein
MIRGIPRAEQKQYQGRKHQAEAEQLYGKDALHVGFLLSEAGYLRSVVAGRDRSDLDFADVPDRPPDVLSEQALAFGQAQRPLTPESRMVVATVVDRDDGEPVTDFAVAYPLNRLEHAQVALSKHASSRRPHSRGPCRDCGLPVPSRQFLHPHQVVLLCWPLGDCSSFPRYCA